MVKIRFIITLTFLLCLIYNTYAQDRILQGIVTTFDSIPLTGASIKVKSNKQVVLTDSVGNFSLTCSDEDIIWVKAKGFYTQKAKLTSNIKFAAINLKIKTGEKNIEYALGYGNVSERDKLYALVNLTNDKVDFSTYLNMYDLIHGRFPGVEIDNGEIIIRGKKSIMGSSAALIILDGIQVDSNVLSSLSTSQVKSIDIIKDGGAAVYGSRGANGVVIIETKRGDN